VLNWFQALLPKNDQFFDLFAAHSHAIVAGAHGLRALLDGGDAVPEYCRFVADRELDADAVTRDILVATARSFITPFDRSSIKHLITAMDDSIDQMQKTAKAVMLFEMRTFTPEMREVGDVIVKCALLVEEAIPLLHAINREAPRINALTEQIQTIEDEADDLHDAGIKALFQRQNGNPMGFITAHEVYNHLEKTVDCFEDVANELQSVVIESV
jgi:predicted phosphate transport protein (TIGR00153 family)